MRQVACRAFLDRGRKNVAASGKQRTLAFRTKPDSFDETRNWNMAGTARQAFIGNGNRNGSAAIALCVENLKLTIQFVNNSVFVIRAGPTHVERFVVGYFSSLAAGDIVSIQIKVDRVANPHWIARGAGAFSYSFGLEGFEIESVKRIRLPAAVTLLGSEIARLRRIDHLIRVRRIIARACFRHRQRLSWSTLNRN